MASPNYDYAYQPGGSLGFRAPSYVEREADADLYESIKAGKFCYVFNCRQMGKSSLRVRVGNRLKQEGYRCAALDLTKVGGDAYLTPGQWYRSLITDLNRSLSLLSDGDFDAWLAQRDELTSAYMLSQFLEDVVLVETQGDPVVIFIDEIDNVLSLSFDTTDLFAVIRSCYNERADNAEYKRLNFALLGVATPAQLMRDTSRTPFNIGKAIRLMPLKLEQAEPLAAGLVGWTESPEQVLEAIFWWTGGQPYLTQRLCELVQEDAVENGAVVTASASNKVAELVEQHILKNWQLQDEQNHFKTIQNRMLRQGQLVNRVLDLYGQILTKGAIEVDTADEATIELRLSGGVVQSGQTLRSFNQIYQHIFDAGWIATNLAKLRPHSATFEAWVSSGGKDGKTLLRGQELKAAEFWAAGRSLSDLDNRYLRESQTAQNTTFRKWAKVSNLISGGIAAVMLGASAISYIAYTEVREQVIASQLLVSANLSKALFLDEKPIESLIVAINAGQLVKQKNLDSSRASVPVVAALQQAIYPNLSFNLQHPHAFREQNRLSGNQGAIKNVNFSPDGQVIASAGFDGTVKLWNRAGKELAVLSGHENPVDSVSFSPDSQIIASASFDGTIKLWNRMGTELATLSGHNGGVKSVSFSPDGQTLASASFDGTVKLWNREGVEMTTFLGHQGTVWDVSFSPDGQTIASASLDERVNLWEKSGGKLMTFSGHTDEVMGVRFSPDGQTIASAGSDDAIKLWNREGRELATLSGHNGRVNAVRFSPDGQTVASAGSDGTIKLWNREGGELATLSGHNGSVSSVDFSPDGQTLASASNDGTVRLWSRTDIALRAFSAPKGDAIRGWAVDYPDSFPYLAEGAIYQTGVRNVSFSPNGQTMAFAIEGGIVKLWSREGQELTSFSGHQRAVWSISFSPDGQTLASASDDGTVKLWNQTGTEIVTFSGHKREVRSVSFSPDGQTLASASFDGTVKLWNREGEELVTLSGHNGGVSSVDFSPDGQTLASAGVIAKLWNREGEELATLSGHNGGTSDINFSPNGQTIASAGADGTVKLWNRKGEELATLSGHNGSVRAVIFSPNGQTIASAGADGTVKLWNREGEELATLSGHNGSVHSVSFSPDGQTIASAGADRTIKLWERDLDSLLTRSCDWLRGYFLHNSLGQNAVANGACQGYL